MESLKVTYKDQSEVIVNVPTSWRDVTFSQYVALLNSLENPEAGEIEAAAILCNMPIEQFEDLPQAIWPTIETLLSFTATSPQLNPTPELLNFDDCNFRQISDVKATIQANKQHPYTCGAMVAAIINIQGYDSTGLSRAKALAKQYEGQPVEEVLPMISFFLDKSLHSLNSGLNESGANTRPKNLRQALEIWNSTVALPSYMVLQKGI